MNLSKLKNHYNLWLDQFEIHPLWLSVKDAENEKKYMDEIRRQVQRLMNFICIVHWIHCILYSMINYKKSFSELALVILHHGSLTASLTMVVLLGKCRLALIDYTTLLVTSIRVMETFLVLYFIDSEMPGFDLVDKKELNDSIPSVAAPALVLACCNFKMDLLITAPITLISTWLVTQRAFANTDDNMACFKNADTYAGFLGFR